MPAKEFSDTDDFLGHSTRSKSTKYVNWKDDGELVAWLHTKQKPIAIWRHGFPRIIVKKGDDDEPMKVVVFGKYNCHEDEDVLKAQFFREKDGSRKVPPEVCGFCRFIEWMYGQVESGAIPWTKPVFRFEHEDPTKTIVIHAAGLYNGFKGELSKEQKEELKKAGISPKKAWGENALAKGEYIFTLVDNAHPENGVVISEETGLLGDKVKDVIVDVRERKGREEGDPFLHPYAIKFIYKGDEDNPQNKYKARPLDGVVLTPMVEKLIKSEPPDLSRNIAPFNPKEMRTFLEMHCLIKNVPWDDLFSKHTHQHEEHKEHDEKDEDDDEDDDMVECDKCEKPMKATDTKCSHCGAEYEVEGADKPAPPPPPPEEKPVRKRSEMKKGKKDGMPF